MYCTCHQFLRLSHETTCPRNTDLAFRALAVEGSSLTYCLSFHITLLGRLGLVERYLVAGIKTEEDVSKYHREFEAQHTSLAKQGVPHSAQALFLRAFDRETHAKIVARLDMKYP